MVGLVTSFEGQTFLAKLTEGLRTRKGEVEEQIIKQRGIDSFSEYTRNVGYAAALQDAIDMVERIAKQVYGRK